MELTRIDRLYYGYLLVTRSYHGPISLTISEINGYVSPR